MSYVCDDIAKVKKYHISYIDKLGVSQPIGFKMALRILPEI